MFLTVRDTFKLLPVHDPGPSVRQQLNRWIMYHYVHRVKGAYRPYCTQYNVCITVPSLLHPIKCVYHCTVSIALDKICVSLYRPYCTRYNVCIIVPSLLQPIKFVYHCTVPIAPDTMCVSLYRLYCTR